MKKCKYCDLEVGNEVTECPSCGASDFMNICDCCGTSFDDGLVCPNCGAKLGTQPKVCPNCGRSYYGASCPRCGNQEHFSPVSADLGKRTSLIFWILGFVLCFPITLVLLILNRGGLQPKVQKVLKIVVWVFGGLVAIQIVMSFLITLLT